MLNKYLSVLLCLFMAFALPMTGSAQIIINNEAPIPPEDTSPEPGTTSAAVSASPTQEALTVENIMIDQTAKDAVVARDQAILAAKRAAFQQLAQRSMTPEQFKTLPLPADDVLTTLVKDFQIKGEQMGGNRYLASFTVRFNPTVADYIGTPAAPGHNSPGLVLPEGMQSGDKSGDAAPVLKPPDAAVAAVPAEEIAGTRDVLVLPYFENVAGQKVLWEDPNPWRDAWQVMGNASPAPNVTVTVPTGDLNDVNAGKTDAIWSGDYTALDRLMTNYDANEINIVLANRSGIQTRVDVYSYRNRKFTRRKSVAPYNLAGNEDPTFEKTIALVLAAIASPEAYVDNTPAPMEDIVLKGPPAPPEIPKVEEPQKVSLEARMTFDHFTTWLEVQRRLSSLTPPPAVDILSLSKNEVRFIVSYDGTISNFNTALSDKGLMFVKPSVQYDPTALDRNGKPVDKPPVYELKMPQWPG